MVKLCRLSCSCSGKECDAELTVSGGIIGSSAKFTIETGYLSKVATVVLDKSDVMLLIEVLNRQIMGIKSEYVAKKE
jgi:hypothetical protein